MTQSETQAPTILERLARGELIISDGATGSYLQQHGLEDGDPEEWNVSHPEVVQGMAKAYFDAGSQMVLTNTFGGTRLRQKHYGFQDRAREFNRLAAEHARSQAPDGCFVVGSVGPTGEVLNDPLRDEPLTEDQAYDAFAEQIMALAEGGVDAVDIETMIDVNEATIAVRAAKENTDLVVMSTMFFDKGPRGFFTMMGTRPAEAVSRLHEAGADIVGANCGNGIDVMLELARELRAATGRLPADSLECGHSVADWGRDCVSGDAGVHGGAVQGDGARCGREYHRRVLRDDAGAYKGAGGGGW